MLIRLDNADMALPFAEGRESHHFQPIMKQFVWMEHENQVQKLFYITEIAKHIFKRCEILGKIFLYVIETQDLSGGTTDWNTNIEGNIPGRSEGSFDSWRKFQVFN